MANNVDEFPRTGSSGSGAETAWSVEARVAEYADPFSIHGMTISHKWKRVYFSEGGPVGVPAGDAYYMVSRHLRLLEYASAQALRWWLHAECQKSLMNRIAGLETRLVRHEMTYQYSEQYISAHALIHGEDRSDILPDWGKKDPAP